MNRLLATLAPRLAAAALVAAALPAPSVSIAGVPLTQLLQVTALVATVAGVYELSMIAVAALASITTAFHASTNPLQLACLVALPALYTLERRLRLNTGSARHRPAKPTHWRHLVPRVVFTGGVAALGYMVFTGGWAAGASIDAVISSLRIPGAAGSLLQLLWESPAFRLAVGLAAAYLAYRLTTSIVEPIFYAVAATREEAGRLLDEMLAEEARLLEHSETWHHRLYRSMLGHVAGIAAVGVAYTATRIYEALTGTTIPRLAALAVYPLVYYTTYKLSKTRLTRLLEKPIVTRKWLYAGIVAALALVVAYQALGGNTAELLYCAVQGCTPRTAQALSTISAILESLGQSIRRMLAEAAGLIDSLLSSISS